MPFGPRWPFRAPSLAVAPDGSPAGGRLRHAARGPGTRRKWVEARHSPGPLWAPLILLLIIGATFLIHYRYPVFPYLIVAVLLASYWRLRVGAFCLVAALALLVTAMRSDPLQPWRGKRDDLLSLALVGSAFVGARAALEERERQRQREQQLIAELSDTVAQLRAREQELLAAQEQLVRSARLAALGQFSATMAHELRNPLNVVKLSIRSVTSRVPAQDEGLQRSLSSMNRSVDRAAQIIDDLLAFSRVPPPQLRPTAVNEIVREAIAALPVPPAVTLEWSLAPDLPLAAADARQIEQAIGNLALNALQAMPEGGRLRVVTRREGERLAITLHDTGAGIPEALRERVFEPFFSTKASGTGLGLPLVREIALAHGGDLTLHCPPEGGACFTLTLPLSADPSPTTCATSNASVSSPAA
jgi:signal transduction histidine kinase